MPPDDLMRLSHLDRDKIIDYFVDYDSIPDTSKVPEPQLTDEDTDGTDVVRLQTWWLDRMIRSPRQLEEKMTFFWHGLFATSNEKVDRQTFMYRQNQLFRTHALGDFEELITAVCIDPAMLVWLDGDGSVKGQPNENFARECMELFSIGIHNYTQDDVRQAARAFTGWHIDENYQVQYVADDHDDDTKVFLGQSGNFNYADIAHMLANHPACGRFLATKLWTFFAYEHPSNRIVDELAGVYHNNSRSIREVVRHMFRMQAFYSTQAQTGRTKSPVEYAITAVRELDAQLNLEDLNNYIAYVGQSIFYPPNVGGWPVGTRWINTATVVARFAFTEWLLEQHENPADNRVDLGKLMPRYRAPHWSGVIQRIGRYHLTPHLSPLTLNALNRFIAGRSPRSDDALPTLEALLQLIMVSPEYYAA
jgi:uncharacterized protein (DUF1800 family)